MFVDYRLWITEVVIDKQLSALIKLSNESRYLVEVLLVLKGEFLCIVKVDNI